MTKLVRRLKQMAKKRAHRKSVQKRKLERAQKENEDSEKHKQEQLRLEEGLEMQSKEEVNGTANEASVDKKSVRLVGGLILDAPRRKAKKQMSRSRMKRKEKQRERGAAVMAQLERKWDIKKRRVKQRAQIRNEDLDN